MPPILNRVLERLRALYESISVGQRIVIGLLVVGLGIGGFVFYSWITTPSMAPLFSNLASADASAIRDELDGTGADYDLEDGGATILVPKDQVNSLRLTMSGKGLPADADTGYALLDQSGITQSEFQSQTQYKRAIEGELKSTLESIDGVRQAKVLVVLPKDEVFATDESNPTASVLLDLAAGTQLSGEQISSVSNLVSSAVEGMDPKDVTVSDTSGQLLSAAGQGVVGGDSARSEMETDYETHAAEAAQAILDRVYGPGHAQVSVRADLDMSQKEQNSTTYTANDSKPTSQSSTDEAMTGTGSAVAGVLGTENEGTTSTNPDSNYTNTTSTTNNAPDTTVTNTTTGPGEVNRMTVAVVLDQAVANGANQATMEDLLGNAVGLNADRGDEITVATLPFDTSAATQAAAEMAQAREDEKSAQMWSLIKTGAIAAGIVLLVLIVWLRSRRGDDEDDDDEVGYDLDDEVMAELERLRVASTRDETHVLDNRALELEAAERTRVRGEISAMVSERPDEVATMLRGWLAESGTR